MVFAVRDSGGEQDLSGLTELVVRGLHDREARALLDSVIRGPIDERVIDRVVAETRGNPLALMELPRDLTPAQLAGGFGLPGAWALAGRVEETFRRRLMALPEATRLLLLVAAAEPVGDTVAVWRAAEALRIDAEAAGPATAAGLIEFGVGVRFRHPPVRSAVYQAAAPKLRQLAHRARRCHRCPNGSRPTRLASRACDSGARRGGRERARVVKSATSGFGTTVGRKPLMRAGGSSRTAAVSGPLSEPVPCPAAPTASGPGKDPHHRLSRRHDSGTSFLWTNAGASFVAAAESTVPASLINSPAAHYGAASALRQNWSGHDQLGPDLAEPSLLGRGGGSAGVGGTGGAVRVIMIGAGDVEHSELTPGRSASPRRPARTHIKIIRY